MGTLKFRIRQDHKFQKIRSKYKIGQTKYTKFKVLWQQLRYSLTRMKTVMRSGLEWIYSSTVKSIYFLEGDSKETSRRIQKQLNYIGVDIGKRDCIVCIMDSDGSIIEEPKYNNTLDHAKSFASYIKRKHGGGKSTITAANLLIIFC